MAFWRRNKSTDTPEPQPPTEAAPVIESTTPRGEPLGPVNVPPSAEALEPVSEPEPKPASESDAPAAGGGLFSRMKSALTKSRQALNTDIRDLFKADGRLVDDQFLTDLFGRLIRTDMGVTSAERIRDAIGKKHRARMVQFDDILDDIAAETAAMLDEGENGLTMATGGPTVILVVGVNGSGKTTSIGKLARHLQNDGHKIVLGAGDTFRAAAVEQLTIWSGRLGCDIVTGKPEADPASVAFRTVERAVETGADVAIVDTAGRLQTQSHLMAELEKIRRVIGKKIPDAPHETLLVLDATAGQNAISQAKGFSEAAGCTGVILAKLDGSAKGGVVLPIREQFQLPIKFVGLGESIEDIAVFKAEPFARALFEA